MIMLIASEAYFLALRAPYADGLPIGNITLEQIQDNSDVQSVLLDVSSVC